MPRHNVLFIYIWHLELWIPPRNIIGVMCLVYAQRYTNLFEHNQCCSFFWNGSSIIEQHCTCRTKIARKCKVGGGSDLKSWLTICPTWMLCRNYTLMSLCSYQFCYSRKIVICIGTEIFISCILAHCSTLLYFSLPPKWFIIINNTSAGRVEMGKVEYLYGKTNRTHAHTTKFYNIYRFRIVSKPYYFKKSSIF